MALLLSMLDMSQQLSGFLAYMQSALYAVVRPSVRLSHGWIRQKRLKLRYATFTTDTE